MLLHELVGDCFAAGREAAWRRPSLLHATNHEVAFRWQF